MEALNGRYKLHFGNRAFVISVVVALIFLGLGFVANFYAGTFATEVAGNPVQDIILSNIPVFDVDMLFLYGPLLLWLFVVLLILYEPRKIPFILKSIALFMVTRSVFVILTHIGPFPDQVPFALSPNNILNRFIFGGDLFFSAHTGLPFLMALSFWNNKLLRIIFILVAIFFGVIVLLGHLHYSIDVLAAFFITYTIYHLAGIFFKKDKQYFDEAMAS